MRKLICVFLMCCLLTVPFTLSGCVTTGQDKPMTVEEQIVWVDAMIRLTTQSYITYLELQELRSDRNYEREAERRAERDKNLQVYAEMLERLLGRLND